MAGLVARCGWTKAMNVLSKETTEAKAPGGAMKLKQHSSRRIKGGAVNRCSSQRLKLWVAAGASPVASPVPEEEGSRKLTRPTAAEFARTIMELGEEGTLSTKHTDDAFPLGTYVAYVLDAIGRPVLALPSNSLALTDLKADNQCSLHVQVELPGLQKPQVTICGRASPPADAPEAVRFELAWTRKYGEGSAPSTPDSSLWLLSVEKIMMATDVDQVPIWVAPEDFLEADADPLKDVARRIVEDVNREHWKDLRSFCHAYAGIEDEVDDASITWVDRLGFDLRVWLRPSLADSPSVVDLRIPFAREAADEREARSALTMMAQVAWEKERNYTPVMPSLVATPTAE